MKIYAISDLHGKPAFWKRAKNQIQNHQPDVLVIAGDFCKYFHPLKQIKLLENLEIPVLFVRGNSERKYVPRLIPKNSAIYLLNGDIFRYNGISFFGLSGALPLPFYTRLRLFENRYLEKAFHVVDENTVVISHPPPRGILDKVFGRFSSGSRNLTRLIREKSPRLFLCGHIHESAGWMYRNKTIVVNCSMNEASDGALVDLEREGQPRITMLKTNP